MPEKIGKVLLDTSCYHGQDSYSDGDETENRLLDIVAHYPEADYPRVAAQSGSWPILYHLSPVRENLLNWIPFKPEERILEVGAGCGAVTGALLKSGAQVNSVDLSLRRCRINATRHRDYDNLKIWVGAGEEVLPTLAGGYDHATLIGVLEYAQTFSQREKPFHYLLGSIREVLKDDGTLWVAIENKLGLKYFAGRREDHTGRYFEGIENYPHAEGPYTFGRRELERLAEACGFECIFYYPYPDYKLPEKIFSDDYLPHPGELKRNWQVFDRDQFRLFDEQKVFDVLLSEGLFPEFSNSFLVAMRKVG